MAGFFLPSRLCRKYRELVVSDALAPLGEVSEADIMTSCHFVWLRQAGLKRRLQPVLYIFGKADWIKKTRPKPGLLNLSG